MESSLVKSPLNSNIELVKSFFAENLSSYSVVEESAHGPYWIVKFSHNDIEINISGDIGFSIEISIGSSKHSLWEYDRSVNDFMKTTDKNILYQLNVLKEFLSSGV